MADDLIDQLTRDPDFLKLSEKDQDSLYEELSGQRKTGIIQNVGKAIGSVYTNVFTRPAAATRGFLQALPPGGETPLQGYVKGSVSPASIPSFQDVFLRKYYGNERPNFATVLGGNVPSALGLVADVVTSPADVLTGIVSGTKPVQAVGRAIRITPAGQAVGEFLTKERSMGGPLGRGIKRVFSNRAGAEMAEQTQQAFLRARRVSNAGYGAQLKIIEASNPSKFVSLPTEANELLQATSNPRTAQLVEYAGRASGSPILEDLLTNPGRKLTLSEAQELKESVNSIPGFAAKLRNPATAQWDVTELPLVRFATQVAKATDEAFPEKVALDTLHATRKGQERILAPILRNPRSYTRGGTPRLSGGLFRSTPPQVEEAYKSVLPQGLRRELGGVQIAKFLGGLTAEELLRRSVLAPFLSRVAFSRAEQ